MSIYVQFADATETDVVAVFACAQDTAIFPNQGQLDSTDERYLAFVDPKSTLAGAQAAQVTTLTTAYSAAVQASVSFTTAAGVAATFQADSNSQDVLLVAVTGYNTQQAVPSGFYWKSADNVLVPFALADLNGLYAAMLAQGWVAFQKLTTLKAKVAAAKTIAAAQAIVW
jgi:hypothetical protein